MLLFNEFFMSFYHFKALHVASCIFNQKWEEEGTLWRLGKSQMQTTNKIMMLYYYCISLRWR